MATTAQTTNTTTATESSNKSWFLDYIGAGNTNKTKQTPGFTEFYLGVLYGSPYNNFTVRNKFKISWSLFNPNYSTNYIQNYKSTSNNIVSIMNNFKLYVDHIDMPGLTLANGSVINDGKGSYYVHGDHMIAPDANEITVWFRDTQISIVDLAGIWMDFNGRPWIRPIRVNLNVDYYSDFDGKTSVMAYQVVGCTPIGRETIKASHEGNEILLRSIKFGFNNIIPVSVSGGNKNSDAITNNWNKLLEQMKQNSASSTESSVFDDIGKAWDGSSGVVGTTGALASTVLTGDAKTFNTGEEEKSILSTAWDGIKTGASATADFVSSPFTSDDNSQESKQENPLTTAEYTSNNGQHDYGDESNDPAIYEHDYGTQYNEEVQDRQPDYEDSAPDYSEEIPNDQEEYDRTSDVSEDDTTSKDFGPDLSALQNFGMNNEEMSGGTLIYNSEQNSDLDSHENPLQFTSNNNSSELSAGVGTPVSNISDLTGKSDARTAVGNVGNKQFEVLRDDNDNGMTTVSVRDFNSGELLETHVINPNTQELNYKNYIGTDENGNQTTAMYFQIVDKSTKSVAWESTVAENQVGTTIYKSVEDGETISKDISYQQASYVKQPNSSSQTSEQSQQQEFSSKEVTSDTFSAEDERKEDLKRQYRQLNQVMGLPPIPF